MTSRVDHQTHRVSQVQQAVVTVSDNRVRNNLYRQAMVEGAEFEAKAETCLEMNSDVAEVYAAMASMKYAKAAALKAL